MRKKHRHLRAVDSLLIGVMALLIGFGSGTLTLADTASSSLARYDKAVDQSVDRALEFLAQNQLADGSFRSNLKGNTGVTSLCIMAFLAKGHTPGNGPYGQIINNGLDFVLSQVQKNGMILSMASSRSHGPMYSHCISTLLLSEVSGMVSPARQKRIDHILPKALQLILNAQAVRKDSRHAGGWRYQPHSRDSDISVTAWAVMALRSGKNNDAAIPKESIDQAVAYVLKCRTGSGGYSYQPGSSPGFARTGAGLLCLMLCGQHKHPATLLAGRYILNKLPQKLGGSHFYYGLYYTSQAMFQLGGDYWRKYAERMYALMLRFQNADGSWSVSSGTARQAGPCYSTAMTVLAITVSYRQLPIYQR